jgi:hypothetical protein
VGIGYPVVMRRWLAAGLLLVGALGNGVTDTAVPFSPTLPTVVGDVSSWTVVSGSFETDAQRGSYRLYVNPERSALYQLMRYRVELRNPEGPEQRRRGAAERVAFIQRPGVSEPMLCWELLPQAQPTWHVVAPGTSEYVLEMNVLIGVLGAHRSARLATPPP